MPVRLKPLGPAAPAPSWEGRGPHAVFDPIAPARQPRVTRHVRDAVQLAHAGRITQHTAGMIEVIGAPYFYDQLATIDPTSKEDWSEMGRVQRCFAAAETDFDPRTRAYSESMRLTLHAAVIEHMVDPSQNNGDDLFEAFLELHVTAFNENGAWIDNLHIGWLGALEVLAATPFEMACNAVDLLQGAFQRDDATVRAAEMVRRARRLVLAGG